MSHAACLQMFNRKYVFVTLVSLVWITGLLVGIALFDLNYLPILCVAILQPASALGIFVVVFLPLIAAYISFLINRPVFAFIVCFLKAVAFSFTGILITHSYNSASWIVCAFFQFSDYCSVILLFALVLRHLDLFGVGRKKNHTLIFFIALFAAIADFYLISPFFQGIL